MNTHWRRTAGFTLIELMIAVAVLGLLASVALPSYQSSVMKTRRTDGQAALMKALVKQEQYFLDNKGYATSITNLGYALENSKVLSDQKYYELTLASGASATAFTLQAVPQGVQASDTCGTLTLTSLGVKGRTGGAPLAQCW